MVPALRERQEQWAVLEAFDEPKVATARSARLSREWKDSEAIEARLQFRACKMLEGGAKVYVRLRKASAA